MEFEWSAEERRFRDELRAVILGEELWSAGEPRGSQYMNVNWIGPAIIAAGTPEQKQYHLRRITSGDVTWCQGFSEQGAGTDLANLQTRAVRDGDCYVVNGEKVWTSYAQEAEFCFLLARTDPGSAGIKGISTRRPRAARQYCCACPPPAREVLCQRSD